MKKYILMLLFCVTAPIYAFDLDTGYGQLYLKITIKNNTPDTCVLIHKTLEHGHISPLIAVPEKIPAGYESVLLMYENTLYGSAITLSYFCGDNRYIALKSQRKATAKAFLTSGAITFASIESNLNMDATYDVLPGDLTIFGDQPGSVYWNLY